MSRVSHESEKHGQEIHAASIADLEELLANISAAVAQLRKLQVRR